jgi:hypothetical protein
VFTIDYHIWTTISGENIDTPGTGTLQSALTQQHSGRRTRSDTVNVETEDQFDSVLREPDDPMHGVEDMIIALAYLYSNLTINHQ